MTKINLGIKLSIKNFNLIPEIYDNHDLINFIEIILNPEFIFDNFGIIKELSLIHI